MKSWFILIFFIFQIVYLFSLSIQKAAGIFGVFEENLM